MTPSDLVKVKPLEWEEHGWDWFTCKVFDWWSYSVDYTIHSSGKTGYSASVCDSRLKMQRLDRCAETVEDAQAACQAHYEQSIYELLEVR